MKGAGDPDRLAGAEPRAVDGHSRVHRALLGGDCIMGSPCHLVVRSTWGHLTTRWRDFCFIQLSLLGSQTCANIEYLLVYRWQNFTPRWSVSPLGGDFQFPVVRFSFLSLRMEEFAYSLVAGGGPMIQSPPRRTRRRSPSTRPTTPTSSSTCSPWSPTPLTPPGSPCTPPSSPTC